MNNTPDSPAKPPDDRMDQGGNYWALFTPGIWKVLHAVLHFVAIELACKMAGHFVQHGAVGGVAGGDFQRHDLAFVSQEKLPLYLSFFEFVHGARRRGKALLGALLAALVV
jgi:hypothetical protein